MRRHRRLVAASGVLLLVLATRTPAAGLAWIVCGGLLATAAWRLPDSFVHRSRELQWEAALHRAAEGWPTAHDRRLIRLDRLYRGGLATAGVFLVLYGLTNL